MTDNMKIDLNDIVKKSLKKTGLMIDRPKAVSVPTMSVVKESYVAEPKKYGQVSEFATAKAKDAHYKLYTDAVEALNKVSTELDTVSTEDVSPEHSVWSNLKCDEVKLLNTVWLHELYFANCFDPHSEIYMESISYLRLERDFGNFEKWQKSFIACAMAAGDGWAVTGYDMFLKKYITVTIEWDASYVPVGFYPIIVLDCHTHAYWKDYLNDRKNYIVAFMRELAWNTIDERVTKAEKIAEVLK